MDIKKVDDKPMEIHTKKKSKLHINRPREGTIKGNGVYTKRSIKDVFDEKDASIKIKNAGIHIKKSEAMSKAKSIGSLGVDIASDNMEGVEEIRDAVSTADYMLTPAGHALGATARSGANISRQAFNKAVEKASLEMRKRKIKKLDISKKLAKDQAKRAAKYAAKKTASGAAKETSKEVAKDTAKTAAEISAQIAAEVSAEVATEVAVESTGAFVGTAAGPEGTILGWAAGAMIGKEVGNEVGRAIEKSDAKATIRLRKIRWFIDKTKAEEEQKDSLVKMIRDVTIRDIIMRIRTVRTQTVIWGALFLMMLINTAVTIAVTLGIIYNSPLAVFFPSPDTGYEDIRTVLCSYYMDFNQKVMALEESGNEITYQNTKNGVQVSNFNDTLMVYMVLYSDGEAGYVMDKKGKKNLKKVFDEMNYIDDSSSKTKKKCGDSIGKVWVTAYCPCTICCGPNANGITASGKKATARHTIAVDAYHPIVPMGTKVIIEGTEYTVEDTGDLNHYGNDFDIFYAKHEDCNQWGRKHVEAFLADGNTNTVTVTTSGTTVHNLTYKDYMDKKKLNEDQKKMLTDLMDSGLWDEYYSAAAGEAVAQMALTKVGCKYDQSKRMEEGYYDCSSLVYRLYKEVGIELPTVADTQGEYCFKNAMLVNKEDLKPGDLIFYSYEQNGCFRNISHVAIYVGNGKMVHAAGKARGVVLDPLRDSNVVFYARPYK